MLSHQPHNIGLVLWTVVWKDSGLTLNPVRGMWDFSARTGFYPELGVLWAQWEGSDHAAELRLLQGCI